MKRFPTILGFGAAAFALFVYSAPVGAALGDGYTQDYQCHVEDQGSGGQLDFYHSLSRGLTAWGVEIHPMQEGNCSPHAPPD